LVYRRANQARHVDNITHCNRVRLQLLQQEHSVPAQVVPVACDLVGVYQRVEGAADINIHRLCEAQHIFQQPNLPAAVRLREACDANLTCRVVYLNIRVGAVRRIGQRRDDVRNWVRSGASVVALADSDVACGGDGRAEVDDELFWLGVQRDDDGVGEAERTNARLSFREGIDRAVVVDGRASEGEVHPLTLRFFVRARNIIVAEAQELPHEAHKVFVRFTVNRTGGHNHGVSAFGSGHNLRVAAVRLPPPEDFRAAARLLLRRRGLLLQRDHAAAGGVGVGSVLCLW
jgi:hypothetical protein